MQEYLNKFQKTQTTRNFKMKFYEKPITLLFSFSLIWELQQFAQVHFKIGALIDCFLHNEIS